MDEGMETSRNLRGRKKEEKIAYQGREKFGTSRRSQGPIIRMERKCTARKLPGDNGDAQCLIRFSSPSVFPAAARTWSDGHLQFLLLVRRTVCSFVAGSDTLTIPRDDSQMTAGD